MTARTIITMDDMIFLASIPIEMLQYMSMGPSFNSFFQFLDDISKLFAFEIDNVIYFTEGVY